SGRCFKPRVPEYKKTGLSGRPCSAAQALRRGKEGTSSSGAQFSRIRILLSGMPHSVRRVLKAGAMTTVEVLLETTSFSKPRNGMLKGVANPLNLRRRKNSIAWQ